jgi:hypothetical protein
MKQGLLILLATLAFAQAPYNYDPFAQAPKETVQSRDTAPSSSVALVRLHVSAVLGERAFVNGQWRVQGESVGEHEIAMIHPSAVGFKKAETLWIIPVGTAGNVLEIKERE